MRAKLRVSPALSILLGLLIYVDRYGLVLPFVLGAALHESAHLLTMRLLHVPVSSVVIGLRGAVISARFPSQAVEALCTLAGPLCSLLLTLPFWPLRFRAVNALLLFYNALPVYPLDGGRLLRLLLIRLLGTERGERLGNAIGVAALLSCAGLCLYAAFYLHWGVLPVLTAALFLSRLPILPCQTPLQMLQYRKTKRKRGSS